ncbi:hypothetical protein [Oceanicaulis alexandrii]|uniref:hypothetical protein n=1 Tax=Oceanicaulis alexandrii TaxID=153233 RepID=UPI0003B402C5|nr:hypothetical protein [Oceanicaulis alexandrii]
MTDKAISGTTWQEDPISKGEKAQYKLLKWTAPIIVGLAVISGVFSGVGVIYMQEQLTPFIILMGIGLGGVVALIVSTAATSFLSMAEFALTGLGKIVLGIAILITLAITLAISTTTNMVFLLDTPSRTMEREQISQGGMLLLEQSAAIGSQLDSIHRTLEQNQDYFLDLQLREVAGTNSRGGDEGPISNHYGIAAALFTPGLESVQQARRQFDELDAEAEELVDRLIETTRDETTNQAAYAAVVQDLRGTIRRMAALEPDAIARSSAMRIRTNVQTPVDLPAYGGPLVAATQERLPAIARELDSLADSFEGIELPELAVRSPVDRVFSAAPHYKQLVAMAIGLDMLPFLIFLFRLPAMLAIQDEIRRKKEQEMALANAGAPDGSITIREVERAFLSVFASARTIETLMENHDPMDKRLYDLLGPQLSKFISASNEAQRTARSDDDNNSEREAG